MTPVGWKGASIHPASTISCNGRGCSPWVDPSSSLRTGRLKHPQFPFKPWIWFHFSGVKLHILQAGLPQFPSLGEWTAHPPSLSSFWQAEGENVTLKTFETSSTWVSSTGGILILLFCQMKSKIMVHAYRNLLKPGKSGSFLGLWSRPLDFGSLQRTAEIQTLHQRPRGRLALWRPLGDGGKSSKHSLVQTRERKKVCGPYSKTWSTPNVGQTGKSSHDHSSWVHFWDIAGRMKNQQMQAFWSSTMSHSIRETWESKSKISAGQLHVHTRSKDNHKS